MTGVSDGAWVIDRDGRKWVAPFDAVCPACATPNKVHDVENNHCFRCDRWIFESPRERSGSGLLCPYCRTPAARIGRRGYSIERGVPEDAAKYMGLWRTEPVGICDRCGETWGCASKGMVAPCPACGSMHSGLFGYGVQRNCWDCGTVWKSPPPQKPDRPKSHAWKAIDKTITFVVWLVGIGIALGLLLYSWPFLLGGAVLLSPVFLFFYVRSRLRGRDFGP